MTATAPRSISPRVTLTGSTISAQHAARAGRVGWGMLGFYGIGGMAEHVISFGLSNLLLFYLTIVCGLSGSAAGLAMGGTMVLDAVAQPVMGSLSDNTHSRHGRRHPFMLAGAIPLAVGFGLLYSIPATLTGAPLFAYAMGMLLITRLGHAVFNVPYVALGSELTDDYHERSLVVASRILFGALGGAVATYLAFGVFMHGHAGQTHREAYAPLAWSCAAIVAVASGISIVGTLGARKRLHSAAPSQRFGLLRFLTELGELFRNPSYRAVFLTALALMIAWGGASALGLHANTYFWKLKTPQILSLQLLGVVGFISGCFIAAGLSRFMQKRTKTFLGMGMIALCQFGLVPLRLSGHIPPESVLLVVTIATMLSQAGLSITLIAFQSMMADVADEHESLFGTRREALCYSGTSLAAFSGSGIGAMLAGVTLDAIGFPHGAPKHAVLALSADTVRSLGLVYGPGAGVLTLVAIVSMVGYRLSQDKHATIRAALFQRREQVRADS